MAKKLPGERVTRERAIELLSPKSAILKMVDGRYKPVPREEILELLIGHEIRYKKGGLPTGMEISLWIRGICVCYLETVSVMPAVVHKRKGPIKVKKSLAKGLRTLRAKMGA